MPTIYDVGWPAWIVVAIALALWVGLLGLAIRLFLRGRETVICPIDHRVAKIVVVRGPDGARADVVRCSLLERPTLVTCAKGCLEARPA
jgi:hypothetical protein